MILRNLFQRLRFVFAKAQRRIALPALSGCDLHPTSAVLGGSQLTQVTMGRYSYCGYNCTLTDVDIGSFCSIADRVVIGGAEHTIDSASTSPTFHKGKNILGVNFSDQDYQRGRKTRIGHDVWIGHGAMIKSGVAVGTGAVIGMGAIVTKDVPPYTIWGGNPARQIRTRLAPEVADQLLASNWWEAPESDLRQAGALSSNPTEFLKALRK